MKNIIDKATKMSGYTMNNLYIVDAFKFNATARKTLKSSTILFKKHSDNSHMISKYTYKIISVIIFTKIPNDVKLILISYDKKRKSKTTNVKRGRFSKLKSKLFGSKYEYVKKETHNIKENDIFIIPEGVHYDVKLMSQHETPKNIETIWTIIQVGPNN